MIVVDTNVIAYLLIGGKKTPYARAGNQSRLITEERTPAPKPLSMFTTATVGEHELSIPRRAETPPKLAP